MVVAADWLLAWGIENNTTEIDAIRRNETNVLGFMGRFAYKEAYRKVGALMYLSNLSGSNESPDYETAPPSRNGAEGRI